MRDVASASWWLSSQIVLANLEAGYTRPPEMFYQTVFDICGIVSFFLGLLSLVLSLFGAEDAAALFSSSVVMMVVGLLIVCSGFLPDSWIRRVKSEKARMVAFGFLLGFAAVGLLLAAALLSRTLNPGQGLAYWLCPACIAGGMFAGHSLFSQFWVSALLNAIVLGAIGGVVGIAFNVVRASRAPPGS